ncbi:hypothetical protein KBX50_05060 [Micromonospora sp. C51]|uniref:hypothetical protein n=1 Tax=Micromonospora sp. C51 TaxID=2824879 RepID=UPI001B378D5A|nr:hypothetical protein [Micromonospora sp. C51]MBQ1047827.1 hypothetical protein [Micromonospora sp. C51]
MGDVLAIVGSTWFADVTAFDTARTEILGVFHRRRPDAVVSGGAPGIDSLAARLAREHGIPVQEHLPRQRRWAGEGGFEERNLLIARDCTRLMRIACRWSPTYGSGWTLEQARRLGADTWNLRLPQTLAAGTLYAPVGRSMVGLLVRDGVIVALPAEAGTTGWLGRPVDPVVMSLRRRRVRAVWVPLKAAGKPGRPSGISPDRRNGP